MIVWDVFDLSYIGIVGPLRIRDWPVAGEGYYVLCEDIVKVTRYYTIVPGGTRKWEKLKTSSCEIEGATTWNNISTSQQIC
jgi:hypothetical protein